jgi:fructokinase
MKNAVVCLGELLIDFVPEQNGLALKDVGSFRRAAGGAPANVAAAVAKLGGTARFIGKIGRDPFGQYLRETLESVGVEAALVETGEARTGLAFVSLRDDGERDFLFYRDPAADMLLTEQEVCDEWLADAAIFHFGSVSLIHDPCRTATLAAAKRAKELGALVSYDPNVRLALWPDEQTARREIMARLPLADVVKVSDEEIGFLLGTDIAEGAHLLLERGPQAVVATLGASGCRVFTRAAEVAVPALRVDAIDTTGAGDGFVGGLLYQLARRGVTAAGVAAAMSDTSWVRDVFGFACAVGALTATKRGAIPALPTLREVEAAR